MMIRRSAALVALGLVLAGCTGGGAAPTSSATAAPPLPPGSPVTVEPPPEPTPEEEAAFRAEEVMRAYQRVRVQCLGDPLNAPITCFDAVATATELNASRNTLSGAQTMQTTMSGAVEVVSVEVVSVALAIDLSVSPPTVPEVVLRICQDVSGIEIVDSAGQSIVPADRLDRQLVDYSVLNYSYPDPAGWLVGQVTGTGTTC